MHTNGAKAPPRHKREYVLIFLTTLILAGTVAVIVANDAFSFAVADQTTATSNTPDRPAETSKAKKVTATKPKEKQSAATVDNIVVVSVGNANQRIPAEAEQQELPTPARSLAPASVTSKPAASLGSPYSQLVGPIILTSAVIFALAIASILVLMFCVLGMLRWHSRRFGPLLSIEHIGVPPTAAQSALLQTAPTSRSAESGPAFMREHQPAELSANRQHDPLVQQFFEEALQLQVEIDLARKESKTPE